MCGAKIGVLITRGVGMVKEHIQWRNQAWRIRQQQVELCLRRVGRGITTIKDEQLLRHVLRKLGGLYA